MFNISVCQSIDSTTTKSSDIIVSYFLIPKTNKLILTKLNGDIDIFINEEGNSKSKLVNFKNFQTYSNFFKHEDSKSFEHLNWYYCKKLKILVAKFPDKIHLLNATNLQIFDTLTDKRGIKECWFVDLNPSTNSSMKEVVTSNRGNDVDTDTDTDIDMESDMSGNNIDKSDNKIVFAYSTIEVLKLKFLLWQNNIFSKSIEIQLPHTKKHEYICSIKSVKKAQLNSSFDMIILTNLNIYLYSLDDSALVNINDRIFKKKYSGNLVRATKQLIDISHEHGVEYEEPKQHDNSSILSFSRSLHFFSNSINKEKHIPQKVHHNSEARFILSSSLDQSLRIIDLKSNNLLTLMPSNSNSSLPYLSATYDFTQFISSIIDYKNFIYIFANFLLIYDDHSIKIVDYRNGFIFLDFEVEEKIRKIQFSDYNKILILTKRNNLLVYILTLKESSLIDNDVNDHEYISSHSESLLNDFDARFINLWKKVIFYKNLLKIKNIKPFFESSSSSCLNLLCIRLRDVTVLISLTLFDRAIYTLKMIKKERAQLTMLRQSQQSVLLTNKLTEVIISSIFTNFIDFWAPPQLVILRTFPEFISSLVPKLTGHQYQFFDSKAKQFVLDKPDFDSLIAPSLSKKWLIPYLTDTRRHLRTFYDTDKKTIDWVFNNHKIKQSPNFFMMDDHDDEITVGTLLILVETALFLMYIHYNPSMVNTLMSVENLCDFEIVQKELIAHDMFKELIEFFYKRGKHVEALKFIITLNRQLDSIEDEHKEIKLSENISLLVFNYLKNLSFEHLDIIFEYTSWLLSHGKITPSTIFQELFLTRTNKILNKDKKKIYEYIYNLDKNISLNFLEIIASETEFSDTELFSTLITRYLSNIDDTKIRIKLKSFLKTNQFYDPNIVLSILEKHLSDESNFTDANSENQIKYVKSITTFPLHRLGKYQIIIDTYFDELNDYFLASAYCNQLQKENNVLAKELILYFFKKIVKSDKDHILYFLQDHGSELGPITTLKLLPKHLKMVDLKKAIYQTVQSTALNKERNLLKQNILQVELVNTSNEFNQLSASYIILDDSLECPICKKTFSLYVTDTFLWFRIGKRNIATHYNCGKILQSRIEAKVEIDNKSTDVTLATVKSEV